MGNADFTKTTRLVSVGLSVATIKKVFFYTEISLIVLKSLKIRKMPATIYAGIKVLCLHSYKDLKFGWVGFSDYPYISAKGIH